MERTADMQCAFTRPTTRTFLLRALSVSAVAASMLLPLLAPVAASDRATPVAATGSVKTRFLSLGVGKSVVVDLSHDIKDVLVADPKIANAVIH